MRNVYRIFLVMLAISFLASAGMASSLDIIGENVQDMSFHSSGPNVAVSFAGSAEDNQGILIFFGTEKHEGGETDLADFQGTAFASGIFNSPGSSEIISVENYDGNPYTFSATNLQREGKMYAVLIRNSGKVSMGSVPYSFTSGSLVLGAEEKEIPIITNDRVGYAQQNPEAQQNMVFRYAVPFMLNYRFFVDFGETKEGTLLAFGTNVDENGNVKLIDINSGLLGGNSKIRCLKNFDDKVFDLPPSDLGGKDGNLFIVLMDNNDGTSIGTIPYYPSSIEFIRGGAAVSPKI